MDESRRITQPKADNPTENETIIITAYEPDSALWEPDFKRKREQK